MEHVSDQDRRHTDAPTLQAVFCSSELLLEDTCGTLGLAVISSRMSAWENVCVSSQQLTSKIPACKKAWRLMKAALI